MKRIYDAATRRQIQQILQTCQALLQQTEPVKSGVTRHPVRRTRLQQLQLLQAAENPEGKFNA